MQDTAGAVRVPDQRRQWGSDRRREPLPPVAPRASDHRLGIGRLAIVLTVSAWAIYVVYTIEQQFVVGKADSARLVIEAIVYLVMVTGLATSAMAFLITRIGAFYRIRGHVRAPRVVLDAFFDTPTAPLTVIVPSYQEDERVIRTTLLSAALQEYPALEVVLLIDDPQQPTARRAKQLLADARALPGLLQAELDVPAGRFRAAQERLGHELGGGSGPTPAQVEDLAGHYRYAVQFLRELGARYEIVDHTDQFFSDHVLGALARDLSTVADALVDGAREGVVLPAARLLQLHRRLVSTFGVRVTSFERKRYRSLSHEPNKAMNLNSYIGLMGGSYQEVDTPRGRALVRSSARAADLVVPEPTYVLTLDADSMLLPEYAARMVYLLAQSAQSKVAVAQTPYSSFPGSATRLERISGASTDLQHVVHQGMTQYDATFWVGANAVLRKKALDEIVAISYDGDFEIRRYIQDRTVIEDTESTIDLGVHGWSLTNYPERLAYSATPPDFGSLCIQRQRWANGGLLILPKLREQVRARRARGERNRFGELFLRVNYMASIAWSSVCLLVMLVYPFNSGLLNPLLLLVSIPYFLMMASDLHATGYKRTDVFRIYGFNLILLPVNLSGSFASVLQLITGEKSAFKRTPKIRDRTTAGAVFILAPLALIALCVYTIVLDVRLQRWENLVYAALNATLATYAMVAFVGVGNSIVDLWVHLRDWLYRPVSSSEAVRRRDRVPVGAVGASAAPAASAASSPAWASVLQYDLPSPVSVVEPAGGGVHSSAGPVPQPRHDAADANATMVSFGGFVFFTVFQPIVDLTSAATVGYEALCRFADGRPPQDRLDSAAADGGIGAGLDAAMMRASLFAATALPEGAWVALNVSPGMWSKRGELASILAHTQSSIVLEPGAPSGDQSSLKVDLPPGDLPLGVRVTLEDPLVGYDSFSRIEEHRPAFLKLGRETTAGIEHDAARRALLSALAPFAAERGCQVIASGVETAAEREALRRAGVHLGQGFYLGLPAPAGLATSAAVG